MTIRQHFDPEVLAESDVELSLEERRELGEVLEYLVDLQDQDQESTSEDKVLQLAVTAFVAGRSNQKEKDLLNPPEGMFIPMFFTPLQAQNIMQVMAESLYRGE